MTFKPILILKKFDRIILSSCLNFYRLNSLPKRKPSITLSMITHNEGSRYLYDVLTSIRPIIAQAVIVDDNSADNTIEIIKTALEGCQVTIIHNEHNIFSKDESILRKILWKHTIERQPDWILTLDADELFEDGFEPKINEIIQSTTYDFYRFRLYDMWDDIRHFREDENWHAHQSYRTFLFRYYSFFPYHWNRKKLHCGRVPDNLKFLNGANSEIRIRHLGWMKKEDRLKKYERYLSLDGAGVFGDRQQYSSILDEKPNLAEWTN